MKRLLVISLLVSVISGNAQNNQNEAALFFKQIVKTYFDRDCSKFYSSIADTVGIISLYGEAIIEKSKLKPKEEICEKFDYWTKSFQSFSDYIDNYKIIVLSKSEFTSKEDSLVLEKIKNDEEGDMNRMVYEILGEFNRYYTDNDFLVFGNLPAKKNFPALNDAGFWMIVRKTSGGWKIFATQP